MFNKCVEGWGGGGSEHLQQRPRPLPSSPCPQTLLAHLFLRLQETGIGEQGLTILSVAVRVVVEDVLFAVGRGLVTLLDGAGDVFAHQAGDGVEHAEIMLLRQVRLCLHVHVLVLLQGFRD